MQFSRFFLIGALVATACADDDGTVSIATGELDSARLGEGATVTLAEGLGTVSVPMVQAVPEVTDAELSDELAGSASLVVSNPESGASADLASGTYVEGDPAAAGEYTWAVSEDRMEVVFTFFNKTAGGLTLKAGSSYEATMSVSSNAFIDRVAAFEFDVAVED